MTEAFNWRHGVFLASNISSESTAAAEHTVGELLRDPFAMRPFCGYNIGDYFAHWLSFGDGDKRAPCPASTSSNWFLKDAQGRFVWPGFGENCRVLKWIAERLEGRAEAEETAIGRVPSTGALDVGGLGLSEDQLRALFAVDPEVWNQEAALIASAYDGLGGHLPESLWEEHRALARRLASQQRTSPRTANQSN